MEALEKESKAAIPSVILNDEIDRMLGQMRADIERMGGKFADYLEHTKKTEEDLRNEYKDMAHKRALGQLMLAEIAKKENLMPNDDEIDVEMIKIMQQVPNAKEANAKGYVTQMLMNEKVLKFLTK